MRLHLFILLLFTSLCFGVDFNAKTEENRAKIMKFCVYENTESSIFEKYEDSLWFSDEEFARELLSKVSIYNLDKLLRNIKNKNILNDKKVFIKIVKECKSCFRFASDTLKSDRKYVLKLIQAGYNIYSNIDNKFYADKEITLLSVKQSWYNLKITDKKLKNDKEVVLEAVQNSREALEYASNELRDDKEVVWEAINYDPISLRYASKRIKDDKEIVWEAIQNNGRALRYVSSRFKNDKKFVLEALKTSTDSLAYANKEMLKDRDVILYFFKMLNKEYASYYHNILTQIDPSLLDDEEIMLEAVGKNGMFLQYASKRLRKNKTLVLKAVSGNGLALKYADKTLRENQEIVRSNPKAKYYIDNAKNKIKRKVKPLAWESYNIDDTLELLYGKDRVYERSKDIDIKLATNTEEYFDAGMGPGYIQIHSNKKVKSIAILQDKEADRALVALYYPYGNIVNIRLALKILNAMLTMDIEGMKVVIIIETEDNHLFKNKYIVKYNGFCTQFDAMGIYMDELKRDLNKTGFKTKYQIDENRVGYLKFQILNTMLNYDEAEKFNVDINFVSHIEGHSKDKKLFDLYTSEYISKNPFIKMKFENMKQDEGIELSYTTINGKVKSKYAKPRKMKKKSH